MHRLANYTRSADTTHSTAIDPPFDRSQIGSRNPAAALIVTAPTQRSARQGKPKGAAMKMNAMLCILVLAASAVDP